MIVLEHVGDPPTPPLSPPEILKLLNQVERINPIRI